MKKLGLLFSHELTEEQRLSVIEDLEVTDFIYMPEDIQSLWSNVPSDLIDLKDYLEPVKIWVKNTFKMGDYLLIQGDFGASYELVNYSKKLGLIPIYSTTKRNVIEEIKEDGRVETIRNFKHEIFRKY